MSALSTCNWHNWLLIALGGWLVMSPLVLQQTTPVDAWAPLTIWSFVIMGALALLVAVAALAEWLGLALGAWLTVSPWVIGFDDTSFAQTKRRYLRRRNSVPVRLGTVAERWRFTTLNVGAQATDENLLCHMGACPAGGNSTTNLRPGRLSRNSRRAPWRATIAWTMERPSPVPRFTLLASPR